MSTLATTTARRPAALTVAAVVLAALSLISLSTPLLVTAGGPPIAIVFVAVVFGITGLAATFGLWRCKRWAAWAAVIVSVLNALSAAPGLPVAPSPALFAGIVASLVGAVLIVLLLLLPSSRKAYS